MKRNLAVGMCLCLTFQAWPAQAMPPVTIVARGTINIGTINGLQLRIPPTTAVNLAFAVTSFISQALLGGRQSEELSSIHADLQTLMEMVGGMKQQLDSMQTLLLEMNVKLDVLTESVRQTPNGIALQDLIAALDRIDLHEDDWRGRTKTGEIERASADLETAALKLIRTQDSQFFPTLAIAYVAERDVLRDLNTPKATADKVLGHYKEYFLAIAANPVAPVADTPIAPTDSIPTRIAKLRSLLEKTLPLRASIAQPTFSGTSRMAMDCGNYAPATYPGPRQRYAWAAAPEARYFVTTLEEPLGEKKVCFKVIPDSITNRTAGSINIGLRGPNWLVGSYFRVSGLVYQSTSGFDGRQLFYEATNINDCTALCLRCTRTNDGTEETTTSAWPCDKGILAGGFAPTVRTYAESFGGVEASDRRLAPVLLQRVEEANNILAQLAVLTSQLENVTKVLATKPAYATH